jgi:predicted lipoprotein with Yx(FWY)xxD motif
MRTSRTPRSIALPAIVLAVLLLASAGALMRSAVTLAAGGRSTHAAVLVKEASAKLLVNAQGMTLYVFAPDKPHKSVCYGKCAAFWPPVLVPKGTTVPTTMPGITGKFGVALRTGGARQLTFDGAPLYTSVKDKKPGDMTGQGLDVSEGYWWSVVAGATSSSASSSSSGGRYGY